MGKPIMYPTTVFPAVRIMKDTVKEKDGHVTFKAKDDTSNMMYIFNAFDDMAEKIQKQNKISISCGTY